MSSSNMSARRPGRRASARWRAAAGWSPAARRPGRDGAIDLRALFAKQLSILGFLHGHQRRAAARRAVLLRRAARRRSIDRRLPAARAATRSAGWKQSEQFGKIVLKSERSNRSASLFVAMCSSCSATALGLCEPRSPADRQPIVTSHRAARRRRSGCSHQSGHRRRRRSTKARSRRSSSDSRRCSTTRSAGCSSISNGGRPNGVPERRSELGLGLQRRVQKPRQHLAVDELERRLARCCSGRSAARRPRAGCRSSRNARTRSSRQIDAGTSGRSARRRAASADRAAARDTRAG